MNKNTFVVFGIVAVLIVSGVFYSLHCAKRDVISWYSNIGRINKGDVVINAIYFKVDDNYIPYWRIDAIHKDAPFPLQFRWKYYPWGQLSGLNFYR